MRGAAALPLAALLPAARAAAPGQCAMNITQNLCVTPKSVIIGNVTAPSAEDCCSACGTFSGCLAWTWHQVGGRCYLASRVGKHSKCKQAASGCTGAGCSVAPPPSPAAACPALPPPPGPSARCLKSAGTCPNIVLFLTDDQDVLLGGWEGPMRKASKVLSAQGATARNWFIHTPVCCPSRNELVTGRYFHNIRNDGPKGGCMHVNQTKTNQQTFAVPLQAAGYRVGIFGKYLNHMPSCQPRGFERYFANNGGKYYGCSFEDNEAAAAGEQFGTYQCAVPEFAGYSTSVIGNKSVAFIRDSAAKQQSDGRPWMAYIAPKAPHVPSQPARWYENATLPGFPLAPRTPNYNYSAKDHHPLIANQPIITAKQAEWTDNLFQNRWRCLLSVDDLIDDVVAEVDALGALGATYFLSTSDHGFNLGQLRLTSCKLNTYDNDIRIPMVIRGPGVAPGSSFWFPASNADVAPTLLGLAGLPTDPSMDGRSVLHQLLDAADPALLPATREHVGGGGDGRAWKSFQLIEYMSLGKVTRNGHDIDEPESNTYRSLRFVNSTLPGLEYQNALYAEFTDLDDWGLEDMKWFEFFNLDEDPWEMTNLYATLSNVTKAALHATVLREWGCRGASCS